MQRRGSHFDDDSTPLALASASSGAKPGGRLPIDPERAVELFRQVVEAFDRADLLAAVSPLKDLRLFGITVRITLSSRSPGGPRHADRR